MQSFWAGPKRIEHGILISASKKAGAEVKRQSLCTSFFANICYAVHFRPKAKILTMRKVTGMPDGSDDVAYDIREMQQVIEDHNNDILDEIIRNIGNHGI